MAGESRDPDGPEHGPISRIIRVCSGRDETCVKLRHDSGRLPPSLTVEKLRVAHQSLPANPLIAESMYLLRYIERMGTGTVDMIRRCAEAGLPEPEFEAGAGFVTRDLAEGRDDPQDGAGYPQETVSTTPITTPKTAREQILVLLTADPRRLRSSLRSASASRWMVSSTTCAT